MLGHFLPEEHQGVQGPPSRLKKVNVFAFVPDAEGRQSEARRRNTRDHRIVGRANVAPVLYQARLWIRLLPKVGNGSPLQFLQEQVILGRERHEAGGGS